MLPRIIVLQASTERHIDEEIMRSPSTLC